MADKKDSKDDEFEIVDALAEGTADSPVEITDSGLTLNLGMGAEDEYEEPAPAEDTPEELAQLAQLEAELNARPRETDPNPSLDRVEMLLDILGNPEKTFPAIHIAGTNGKTSTARLTDSLLRAFHRRTGLFTTPALSKMTECIVIDGNPIPARDLVRIWEEIAPYVAMVDDKFAGHAPMSKFEVLVALAFAAFADAPVDVAVVEVGMGGTWDATNVINADVSVITPIGMDHMNWLGQTLPEIAEQKAGIIKPRPHDEGFDAGPDENIAIIGLQEPDAMKVLLQRAVDTESGVAREGSEFAVAESAVAVGGQQLILRGLGGTYEGIFIPLFGEHQAHNAATALAAVEAFFGAHAGHALDIASVRNGFAQATVPGRFERLRANPAVFVDSAHNAHGMRSLVAALDRDFDFADVTAVVSIFGDKDVLDILKTLEPAVNRVVITQNSNSRAMEMEELAELAADVFGDERVYTAHTLLDAVDQAIELADEDGAQAFAGKGIIITGSVATAGEARTLLGA